MHLTHKIIALLAIATTIFGQNRNREPQMMPGYDASSRIDVRGAWDVFAKGSFLYWQPVQDRMELGEVQKNFPDGSVSWDVINMHFQSKPGFKVGLGLNFDHDDWDTFFHYTRFRGRSYAQTSLVHDIGKANVAPFWGTDFTFFSAQETWNIGLDILNWELARSYYVGTSLSFRPFFAARAAWISQNVKLHYNSATPGQTLEVDRNAIHKNKSHSWAVGPSIGLDTEWMIGQGFRLYGNGEADILFTQYTHITSKQFNQAARGRDTITHFNIIHQKNVNCLRPHFELEFGFGWGSYFANHNCHIDLSLGYGFQVFFDQNMLNLQHSNTSTNPNGNLYVHGLTTDLRFDF